MIGGFTTVFTGAVFVSCCFLLLGVVVQPSLDSKDGMEALLKSKFSVTLALETAGERDFDLDPASRDFDLETERDFDLDSEWDLSLDTERDFDLERE